MNFFRYIGKFFGGNANRQSRGAQQTSPSTSVHDEIVAYGVDGALQVSTVWACVTLLAETIASLPLVTYQSNSAGERKPAKGSSLYRILHDRPNSKQTAMQFWLFMIMNLVLKGNAYAQIVRSKHDGSVVALVPLSADQIEVVVQEDGSVMYGFSTEKKTYIFASKDILHIAGMGNGVVGMSPLDYMRSSIGLAVSAQNHTHKTISKNARRPGILMSDTVLTAEQRSALKENFGDIVTGKDKELYILEAQFKFDPLGMSPADIQLLESRKFAVQDLARWFGVPSVLVNDTGEASKLGSSTYEIIQTYYRLRLAPKLELIEQAIQERVLTPKQRAQGFTVEFNLDAFLRASPKDRMEIQAKAVQNGLRTRNECRAKDNLDPLDGGDILTAQSNLLPIDKLGVANLKGTGSVPEEPIQQ